MRVRFRLYAHGDRDACLALLRANVPEAFDAGDEDELARFLDRGRVPYFVGEDDSGHVVACGGIGTAPDDDTIAILCWGIVHPDCQRRGVGSALLAHRLAALAPTHARVRCVRIQTTPSAQAFFARHGFRVTSVVADGYGPGRDQVFMERPS